MSHRSPCDIAQGRPRLLRDGVPMTAPARLVSRAGVVIPRVPWRALTLGAVLVLIGVEVWLAAPVLAGAFGSLIQARVAWLAAAVAGAALSMGMFARGRRRLMRAAGMRVGLRETLAAVYVANALHLTLPGGTAFSTAYTYRWMRRRGGDSAAVGWALASGGLVATAALIGLGVVGSLFVGDGIETSTVVVDSALVAGMVAAVHLFRRRPEVLAAAGGRVIARLNRVLRRPPERGVQGWEQLVGQLRSVRPTGMDWTAAAVFAVGNWVFDVGCLAASTVALGMHGLTLPLLLIAYTAGMAASGLSLLPGGIGVVETAMVLALVGGGIPAATALPAVLLYRLISLVGVVGAGWVVAAVQAFPRERSAEPVAGGPDLVPLQAAA